MNTSNVVETQKPIQVRKISQLPYLTISYDYVNAPMAYYVSYNADNTYTSYGIDLDKCYILIGYPSTDSTIPHNYKFSLNNIINYCYLSTGLMNSIYTYLNKKIDMSVAYIFDKLSYYFENCPSVTPDEINTYIHYYWNGAEVEDYIKDIEKYWNMKEY